MLRILLSPPLLRSLLVAVSLSFLSGCGGKETATKETPQKDARDEAKAFYAAHPEFFHFKTPADLPANLQWEDGMDLPEFSSPAAKRGGTFNFWEQDFPRTLRAVGPDSNGSFRTWIRDYNAMGFASRHPNLTDVGPNGFHYYPGIADRWALDGASKTVYIHINPKARWSDGPAITADDMLFAFFFYRSSYINAPWYNNFYGTKYAGVTRYDDHTFALHVPELRPDIYSMTLGLEPVPAHFYRELGADYAERYQWKFPPTSGAYEVLPENIEKGSALTLTRVKNWWASDLKFWRHRFNPDRIHLTVIRDSPKALEAFRKGDLDAIGLQLAQYWYDKLPDSAPEVQQGYIKKLKFFNDIPRPTYGFWMNQAKPLLDNRDIRVGINYALNWDLVLTKFSRGDWVRKQTSSDGYGDFTHPTLRSRPYSIDDALAHFAKAGFTKRGPDGILVNDAGQRLSVEVTTGYENLRDVLTILREEALKAGLELRLEVLDNTADWKKTQEKKHEITFTAFAVGAEMFPRYWETNHSVNAYDQAFLPDGSANPTRKLKAQTNNLTGIAIPELDKLIEAYDKADNIDEMKRLAFKMEELIHEDAAFCPGFNLTFIRNGAWRWIGVPPEGNVKIASDFFEYSLYWIDDELKKETKAAMESGKTFPAEIHVFDQYKPR